MKPVPKIRNRPKAAIEKLRAVCTRPFFNRRAAIDSASPVNPSVMLVVYKVMVFFRWHPRFDPLTVLISDAAPFRMRWSAAPESGNPVDKFVWAW